ncbi:MAG: hypothetical protein IJZ77_04860 [Bacilli bacterium]|nr:hypothetical protein [Bacilli bacterium]
MNSKECEEQLKSLIEHFKNGGLDFDATDIKAIEHLLLENKIQQDIIKKKNQENKELHNKIDKAIKYIHDIFCCIHDEELLDVLLGILKDSDVDE